MASDPASNAGCLQPGFTAAGHADPVASQPHVYPSTANGYCHHHRNQHAGPTHGNTSADQCTQRNSSPKPDIDPNFATIDPVR